MVLLFTDIAGSVAIKSAIGAVKYGTLISRHDALFRAIIGSMAQAEIVKDTGDGFLATFANTADAVNAALRFQHGLSREAWGGQPVRVRIGVHLGEITELEADIDGRPKLIGLAADFAARLMSLALPGQILLTRVAFDEARQFVRTHPSANGESTPELRWMAHGPYLFQGAEEPMEVFEVGACGLAPLQAPPNNEKCRSAVAAGEEDVLGWRPAIGLAIPGREHWILERRLGEGGFGEVWLAEHRRTHARRVYKFCFDADRLRSFKRELTLFRLLRDALGDRPDIAQIYEIQLDSPPYFLESEFTEAGNLADWAESVGGLSSVPLATRLDLVARTADAVAAAHSIGVLHKDIKPSNILVYGDRSQPRPRLADFGIGVLADTSHIVQRNITLSGFTETLGGTDDPSRTGTRMYSPPESLTGQPFTIQGDVYALGVLLYQMSVADLARPLAHGWERDVGDPLLRQDIARCVAGIPADRFSSSSELAESLRRIPQRRSERTRRRLIRIASVSSLVLAALLVATAWALVYVNGLRRAAVMEREMAEFERQGADLERRRADEMRGKAITASQQASEVTEFLRTMLVSVDPNIRGGNRDVTVREVLDAAAGRFEASTGEFETQPEVEAAIRSTIGVTYRAIGAFAAAEPHLRTAYDLRLKTLGREHADTIESMMDFGVLLREQGRFAEATPLLSDAFELSLQVHGPQSRQAFAAMTNLAELYDSQNRHTEAETLFKQALALSTKISGEAHPDTLSAMNNLASSYRVQARYAEAEPLYLKLIEVSEKQLGPEHVETLTALNNAAILYDAQGKLAEAQAMFKRVLESRQRVLGPDHPSTLTSVNNLAAVYSSLGRLNEAKALYEQVLPIQVAKFGADHPDTLNTSINLAFVEENLGELDRAEQRLNTALPAAQKTLGEQHSLVRGAMTNLAGVYQQQGRLDKAEELLVKALELHRRYDGPEHPATLSTMSDLAGIYRIAKKHEQSEPLWIEALNGMRKSLGEDHIETLILTNNLAALYRDMERYPESLKYAETAIAGARRALPPDHWNIAGFLTTHGKLLTKMGHHEAAEQSLQEAYASLEKTFGPNHPRTQDVVRAMADLNEAWQKPDAAAEWRAKLPAAQP